MYCVHRPVTANECGSNTCLDIVQHDMHGIIVRLEVQRADIYIYYYSFFSFTFNPNF